MSALDEGVANYAKHADAIETLTMDLIVAEEILEELRMERALESARLELTEEVQAGKNEGARKANLLLAESRDERHRDVTARFRKQQARVSVLKAQIEREQNAKAQWSLHLRGIAGMSVRDE